MTLPADLSALLDDLRPAAAHAVRIERRRRRLRIAAAVAVLAAACTGVALAASHFLGEPAPPSVQSDVRNLTHFVDQPGLRGQTAKVVAAARDATLYGVYDEHGSYCVELIGATRGLILGTTCNVGASATRQGGSISMPQTNVIVDGVTPPVVVYGKLADRAVSAEAILGDGTREAVAIGLGGFFAYQPPDAEQAAARRHSIEVRQRDADGTPVWTSTFPPPLALASEGTPVRRVSGRFEIAGARLVVRDMSGFRSKPQVVPLAPDGSFTWTPPAGLQPDNLMAFSVQTKGGAELFGAIPLDERAWRRILEQARSGR